MEYTKTKQQYDKCLNPDCSVKLINNIAQLKTQLEDLRAKNTKHAVEKRVRDMTLEKVTDTGETTIMKEGYSQVAADLITMKQKITKLDRKT